MKQTLLPDLLLVTIALIWGGTFVVVKDILNQLPPFYFNFLRFMLAGLILLPISFREPLKNIRSIFKPAALLGFILFLAFALQTIGLKYTSASNSGFITGTSVLIVPFVIWFFYKKKPATEAIIGAILAFIGLTLIAFPKNFIFNSGDILTLCCAFLFALHIILIDKYTSCFKTSTFLIFQIWIVAVCNGIFSFIFENISWIMNFRIFIALIITSLLATVIAFYIQIWAQKFVSPTRTAVILTMEPVFALLFAMLLLHERLSLTGWIGCFLIFIGMLVSELKWLKKLKKK